jgi:hypothetical protein
MNTLQTIKIDDVEYIRKDAFVQSAEKLEGMPYVICRTYSAGVFAGYLKSQVGQEVVLRHARRLYYWDGAATLSQASQDGFSKPTNCKFPCEVPSVKLLQTIEILYCSKKAQDSIAEVTVWEA